jgi:preprotein translocase subunit SecA
MKPERYDIFISYRRDTGQFLADKVCGSLRNRGFRPFMDFEEMRSGDFNDQIYETIENTPDFVLILSKDCLDRCRNDRDWLRLEIGHALRTQRNIVPFMDRSFQMPSEESLPADIARVVRYQGVEADVKVWPSYMDILEDYLISRPHPCAIWVERTFGPRRRRKFTHPPKSQAPAQAPAPTSMAAPIPAPIPAPTPTQSPVARKVAPIAPSRRVAPPPKEVPVTRKATPDAVPVAPAVKPRPARDIIPLPAPRPALPRETWLTRLGWIIGTPLFGSRNERAIRRLLRVVNTINAHCETLRDLKDEEIQAKTARFRARLSEGETLDDLLPEAFAVVREACRRQVGKSWVVAGSAARWETIPFDVDMMGGIVLHQGKIADSPAAENRTLVPLMPLYLHALEGKGAHLATANEYLARRGSEWEGEILRWLGLSVGCIGRDLDHSDRKAAYACDVTFGKYLQFGFDYLQGNMVIRGEDRAQRPHHFAIVVEVDSVLIDEAHTPLIISGPVAHSRQKFDKLCGPVENLVRRQNTLISQYLDEAEQLLATSKDDDRYRAGIRLLQVLHGAPKHKRFLRMTSEQQDLKRLIESVENDFMRAKRLHELDDDLLFAVDEKGRTVTLSDDGRTLMAPSDPTMFVLPDLSVEIGRIDADPDMPLEEKTRRKAELHQRHTEKSEMLGNVTQLLRAHCLYEKDVAYVVQDDKVLIVDELTGRPITDRRFSDGLHQALEAKERVRVGEENQTLATITTRNYFRLYERLAGLTRSAAGEAPEFREVYGLDLVEIPTNDPVRRVEYEDAVFRTVGEKYDAIVEEIERVHATGRPVLVGSSSAEVRETLSRMLKRRGINHQVLIQTEDRSEEELFSQAGQLGAVTIVAPGSGRGFDIPLARQAVKGRVCLVKTRASLGDCQATASAQACQKNMPCGLHVIGAERQHDRRIDDSLRDRAGASGDPGSSSFFLSMEDDLLRIFGSDRTGRMMDRMGTQEGDCTSHPFVSKAIARSQRRLSRRNRAIRSRTYEFDDILDTQRAAIYALRNEALLDGDPSAHMRELVQKLVTSLIEAKAGPKARPAAWDLPGLESDLRALLLRPVALSPFAPWADWEQLRAACLSAAHEAYAWREELFGAERMREAERRVRLMVIDEKWRDQLARMNQLIDSLGQRPGPFKDPFVEYETEGNRMFEELLASIEEDTVRYMFRLMPAKAPEEPAAASPAASAAIAPKLPASESATGQPAGSVPRSADSPPPSSPPSEAFVRRAPKIGRNEPCPCGSGKKYRKCCGENR